MRFSIISSFLLSFLILMGFVFSTPVFAAKKCERYFKALTKKGDASLRVGVLARGEHWADLILAQTGVSKTRHFTAFKDVTQQLLFSLNQGRFDQINEKIDGSPSFVIGFDAKGSPFVTYKGHFLNPTQLLLTELDTNSATDSVQASQIYSRAPYLKNIFVPLLKELRAGLLKHKGEFENYVFQADLLFIKGDSKIKIFPEASLPEHTQTSSEISPETSGERISESNATDVERIEMQPNTVRYVLTPEHPFYSKVKTAQIGFVVHSIGKRIVQNGRIVDEPIFDESLIQQFVSLLQSERVFVVDSFSQNKILKTTWDPDSNARIEDLLKSITHHLSRLSSDFRSAWSESFLSKWRIFLNSSLRPPATGGIYKLIAEGHSPDLELLIADFKSWILHREDLNVYLNFEALEAQYSLQLRAALTAYVEALKIQALILPSLQEVFVSKLGGVAAEGLMLKTPDTIVKLVDRLQFTRQNNERWSRGTTSAKSYPYPFDEWRPESLFYVLKGQPVHAGHIQMLKNLALQHPNKKIYVILSDNEPQLQSQSWQGLKIADTKTELKAKEYKYIFSNDTRLALLKLGLKTGSQNISSIEIQRMDSTLFWKYVALAQATKKSGKVYFVVGENEITEGRYRQQSYDLKSHVELMPRDVEGDGVRGKNVRAAVKSAATGSAQDKKSARTFLNTTYAFIKNRSERKLRIDALIAEWSAVDAKVSEILEKSVSNRGKR